jgi:hypothetical protein
MSSFKEHYITERTRFLKDLDLMLMKDRTGAIDDMLQVLREHGAIRTVQGSMALDSRYLEGPDQEEVKKYINHQKQHIAEMMGCLMWDEGTIAYKQELDPEQGHYHPRNLSPPQKLTGSLTIVKRRK